MSRASIRSVALAVSWRTLHNVVTTPAILLPSLIFPLVFFTAFAGGLSQVSKLPGFDFPSGYTAFQFVFVLLQSAAFSGVFMGFNVARDFETGFARRLLIAASHRTGIVVGYALAAVLRWSIVALVLTIVALVAHMKVGGSGVDLVGLYTLALTVNLAGVLWATGIALRLRSTQGTPLMQTPVFLTLFLAPVYVPLDLLRGWIHGVAKLNPLTFLVEAGRGFIDGRPTQVAAAFAIAAAMLAFFAVWARTGLARAERSL